MRAVLFDLDGVLVQTEPLKAEAHAGTVRRFGGDVPLALYSKVMGQSHAAVRSAFVSAAGIEVDPERYTQVYRQTYHELLRTKLEVTPGAARLVQQLTEKQVSLAVVSSSPSATVKEILDRIGLARFFSVHVAADDVERKKPAPDSYFLALDRLSVSPISAVAIEDSEAGVESAAKAGIRVLALRHVFNGHHDFTRAYAILDSLLDTRAVMQMIDSLPVP